jgi:hypothetical protein
MKLDKQFTAALQRSPRKGGWTYVVMAGPAEYLGRVTVVLEERLEQGGD